MGPEKRQDLGSSMNPLGKDSHVMPMPTQRVPSPGQTGARTPPEVAPTPIKPKRGKGERSHALRNWTLAAVIAGASVGGVIGAPKLLHRDSPNTASETLTSQVLGSPDKPTTAIAGRNAVAATPEEIKNFISQPSALANFSIADIQAARKSGLPAIKLKMGIPGKDLTQGEQIRLIPNNYIAVEPEKFSSSFPRDFIFPNNTDVVFAIEGVKEWKIRLSTPVIINGKEYPESFWMLADVGENKSLLLFVAVYNPADRLSYGDAIKNAPVVGSQSLQDFLKTTKESLIVPGDTTIFRTVKPDARIQIHAQVFEKGNLSVGAPIYLDYLTNSSGQGLYPSSQS